MLEPGVVVADAMTRFRQPTPVSWASWFAVALIAYLNFTQSGVLGALGVLGLLLVHDVVSVAVMMLLGARRRDGLLFPLVSDEPGVAPPSWKEGAVIVSGFFAMVATSIVLLVVMVVTKSEAAKTLVASSIGLTLFMLAPLYPYDGWRLLNLTLFSRSGGVETFVAVVTCLLTILLGVALQAWFIVVFGVINAVGIVYQRKVRAVAEGLRAKGVPPLPWDDATLLVAAETTHAAFPPAKDPQAKPELLAQQLSQHLRLVARRVSLTPPTAGITVVLLAVYALATAYQFVALVVAFAP